MLYRVVPCELPTFPSPQQSNEVQRARPRPPVNTVQMPIHAGGRYRMSPLARALGVTRAAPQTLPR